MLKFRSLYTIVAVLIFSIVCAHSSNAKAPSKITFAKPHIYEISSKKNLKSYILGSLHLSVSTSQLPYWVIDLHDYSKVHSYELIPEDSDNVEYWKALQNLSLKPELGIQYLKTHSRNDNKNKKFVSSTYYDQLIESGVSPEYVQYITEEDFEAVVVAKYIFKQPYSSLDQELMLRSIITGTKILPLENENVRSIAERLSNEDDSITVTELLREGLVKIFQKQFEKERSHYLSGKVSSADKKESNSPDMIYRNKYWITTLKQSLNEQTHFITVGYGHLYGKNGLLNMLKKEGFKIKRLTKSPIKDLNKIKEKRYR